MRQELPPAPLLGPKVQTYDAAYFITVSDLTVPPLDLALYVGPRKPKNRTLRYPLSVQTLVMRPWPESPA